MFLKKAWDANWAGLEGSFSGFLAAGFELGLNGPSSREFPSSFSLSLKLRPTLFAESIFARPLATTDLLDGDRILVE